MEFRLTYEGELLASGTDPRQENRPARVADKHRIRRVFHKQLKKLWYTNPNLIPRTMFDAESTFIGSMTSDPLVKTYRNVIERTAANYPLGPFRFVPLVTKTNGLNCKLEILMLRPSLPGGLLNNSDIDNRLKTLFDTLQKPGEMAQIGNETPQNGEDPFFVLVQDDRLITHLSVETDMLLQPVSEQEKDQVNDVRLVITCTVWPYSVGPHNLDFM
jgi:hypothetical protein